jgi:signal transduction histidine kinase
VDDFRRREPDIEVSLSLPEESDPPLSSEAMDSIYHVVTEALTNAGKHARASRIRVEWHLEARAVRVAVEDDGVGMPAGGYSLPDLLRGRHFGLAGMHQWAALAGGRLVIGLSEPHGTRVTLELIQADSP